MKLGLISCIKFSYTEYLRQQWALKCRLYLTEDLRQQIALNCRLNLSEDWRQQWSVDWTWEKIYGNREHWIVDWTRKKIYLSGRERWSVHWVHYCNRKTVKCRVNLTRCRVQWSAALTGCRAVQNQRSVTGTRRNWRVTVSEHDWRNAGFVSLQIQW